MVTEFFAKRLLTNYNTGYEGTEVKSFVDKYDFHIFPIVNPDG